MSLVLGGQVFTHGQKLSLKIRLFLYTEQKSLYNCIHDAYSLMFFLYNSRNDSYSIIFIQDWVWVKMSLWVLILPTLCLWYIHITAFMMIHTEWYSFKIWVWVKISLWVLIYTCLKFFDTYRYLHIAYCIIFFLIHRYLHIVFIMHTVLYSFKIWVLVEKKNGNRWLTESLPITAFMMQYYIH